MEGHLKLRRGLIDHIRAGKLTNDEIAVYVHLLFCADFSTGLQKNSAPHIYYSMGQRSSLRRIQRALEQLEKLGFIKRFRIPGKKKDYHIIVDKYEVTCGVLNKSRVNAKDTKDWRDIQYFPGTDDGTDAGTDNGTEDALAAVPEQAGSDKNSNKKFKKNSTKNSVEEDCLAIAEAAATAVAELSYPTTPESQSLEYIFWNVNPNRPAEDDEVRSENVDKILTLDVPDPVKLGNMMIWTFRTSTRFKEHITDFNSFLKLLPKITKSYDKYYDQDEYHDRKLSPEEKLNNLEKIETAAVKIRKKEDDDEL